MEFGKSILSPSYNRTPDFDSVKEIGEKFSFECINCQNIIEKVFRSIIGQEFSWHSEFDENNYSQIKKFYDMNSFGKTPDGGKTAVLQVSCGNCQTNYLIYASVNEYHNSAYKITLQGITEILDESNNQKI